MHESDIQSRMTEKILGGELDQITIGVTENEKAIIVRCKDQRVDAAYTAAEARELADALEEESEESWEIPAYPAVCYLRELSEVVDGDRELEDVSGVEHNVMELQHD